MENTEFKHTPAPWYLVTAYSNGETVMHDALAIADKQVSEEITEIICLVSPFHLLSETDEANAKAIAATPDLILEINNLINACLEKLDAQQVVLISSELYKATQVLKKATE